MTVTKETILMVMMMMMMRSDEVPEGAEDEEDGEPRERFDGVNVISRTNGVPEGVAVKQGDEEFAPIVRVDDTVVVDNAWDGDGVDVEDFDVYGDDDGVDIVSCDSSDSGVVGDDIDKRN